MDARRPCPDSALLAAFLDGTLGEYERTAVVAHLADCPACRAVAVTVVEFREVEALDALWEGSVAPPPEPLFIGGAIRWSRAKTRAPALAIGALAAVAVLALPLYFFIDSRTAQQAVSTLSEVAAGPRPIVARLSNTTAYAPPPSAGDAAHRGDRARIQLVATAPDIRPPDKHDDTASSRRAVGIAALLVGDLDEAVSTLEIAASAAPDDVAIASDLAAAYYERSQRANRPDDLPAALSAVERALYRQPGNLEALFNRALIITALGLRVDAEAAWQAYLARDTASPWAHEARERL
jgi:tetratricopeptide (TPR) repeat protein